MKTSFCSRYVIRPRLCEWFEAIMAVLPISRSSVPDSVSSLLPFSGDEWAQRASLIGPLFPTCTSAGPCTHFLIPLLGRLLPQLNNRQVYVVASRWMLGANGTEDDSLSVCDTEQCFTWAACKCQAHASHIWINWGCAAFSLSLYLSFRPAVFIAGRTCNLPFFSFSFNLWRRF